MALGDTQKQILDEMRGVRTAKVRENAVIGDKFAEARKGDSFRRSENTVASTVKPRAKIFSRAKTVSTFCRCRYFQKTRTDCRAGRGA